MTRPLANWTQEEQRRFAEQYCVHGKDYHNIADDLGKSKSAMSRAAKHIGIRGHKGEVAKYIEMYEDDDVNPLIQSVRYETSVPVEGVNPGATDLTSVHYADLHIPFEDPRAENILFQILEDEKPEEVYATGDILDFWQISDHRPPDQRNLSPREVNLQEQVDRVAEHAAQVIEVAEPDYAEWRDGNHEDRWDREILDLQQDPKKRHMLQLTRVQEALDLHYILGLKEQGWNTFKYESKPTIVRNSLVLVHGSRANKWYTRSYMDKFGLSTMVFHSHRFQNFTRRNLKGQESGFGIGCLCSLDPHYDQMPDWHQGFAVVDWKKINGEWFFNVNMVRIHDGKAIFRGKVYEA